MAQLAYALQGMTITAKRDDVLARLHKNRDEHKAIVDEARKNYVKRAEEVLLKRLGQLREGKIVSLSFLLKSPKDMTHAYDAAISAIDWHTNATIELTAMQVAMFLDDEWDWTREFYLTNAPYSGMAVEKMRSSGIDGNDDE